MIKKKEGGPGSGPQGGGAGSKPNVLAHYTYHGDRYRAGLKLPKSDSATHSSAPTSSVGNNPSSSSSDVKKKNDEELMRRRASMYQSNENSISFGAPRFSTYPLPKSQTLAGGTLSSTGTTMETTESTATIGPALSIGGVLTPKYPKSPTEADSGSGFPQMLRGRDEKNKL